MDTTEVVAQQVALYGEPLSARFGRLLQAYRIPQSRLAATIGLSAPMLSQLASGQRVKISNPSVYARMLRLEELAGSPAIAGGDPAQVQAALGEVAASRPQLTTEVAAGAAGAAGQLASLASPAELAQAAAAVPGTRLAAVLQDAAERAGVPVR